jgi:hypothetical protein
LIARAVAIKLRTNFGQLDGGWMRLSMPELGLTQQVLGFASDAVMQAARKSHSEFDGLVGFAAFASRRIWGRQQ